MYTVHINPYQTSLITSIRQKKWEGDRMHCILADTLCYDYHGCGIPVERVRLQGKPLERTYFAGDDLVHVIKGNIEQNEITLELDYKSREYSLRELTLRQLIRHSLSRYFNRIPYHFKSGKTQSQVFLSGLYSSAEKEEILNYLEISCRKFVQTGLTFQIQEQNGVQSTLFGIGKFPWAGPHFLHTSEIRNFEFLRIEDFEERSTLYYRLLD